VLILLSLVSPLVRGFLISGPDIAMNFSSLALRDHTHAPVPIGGTSLGAADCFKLLKDVKLRLGDMETEAEVGSIAIGDGNASMGRIEKGRLYE
jgi:hypothetical protein